MAPAPTQRTASARSMDRSLRTRTPQTHQIRAHVGHGTHGAASVERANRWHTGACCKVGTPLADITATRLRLQTGQAPAPLVPPTRHDAPPTSIPTPSSRTHHIRQQKTLPHVDTQRAEPHTSTRPGQPCTNDDRTPTSTRGHKSTQQMASIRARYTRNPCPRHTHPHPPRPSQTYET